MRPIRHLIVAVVILSQACFAQGERVFTQRQIFSNGVDTVSFGFGHTVVLKTDGTIWSAGKNDYGQLGLGTKIDTNTFQKVPIAGSIKKVLCGTNQTYYLLQDSTLWGCGYTSSFNFGFDGPDILVPIRIATRVDDFGAIGTGTFLIANQVLSFTGTDRSGEGGTGVPTLSIRTVPPKVVANNVSKVSVMGGLSSHALFIKTDATAWGMGSNNTNQLGLPSDFLSVTSPRQVLENVTQAATGRTFSVFLKKDGTLWISGFLTGGASFDRPTQLAAGVSQMAAGDGHVVYLTTAGEMFGVGASVSGALGRAVSQQTPVWMASNVQSVFAGGENSAYTDRQGRLWAWGSNEYGQLGTALQLAPLVIEPPTGGLLIAGDSLRLRVSATGFPQVSYQWFKNGVAIAGATASEFKVTSLSSSDGGTYHVRLSNSNGTVDSVATGVTVEPSSTLSNVSVRTVLGPGQILTVGAVAQGTRRVLIRVAGPALSNFGLAGLADPNIELYGEGSRLLARNDNWSDELTDTFRSAGAFAFSSGSADAALLQDVSGPFSLRAQGPGVGTVLVEAYDVAGQRGTRLVNLSAKNYVGTGSDVLIAGFRIAGKGTKQVLIRAIGPTLANFGVSGFLPDPKIEIRDMQGRVLATNNDWPGELAATFSRVGAFPLAANSKDAATVVTLEAESNYSVQVSGNDNITGEALFELYELF